MDLSFIERIFLKYLENHPEVIEKLVDALIQRLVHQLAGPPPA